MKFGLAIGGAIMLILGLIISYYAKTQSLQVVGVILAIAGFVLPIAGFIGKKEKTLTVQQQVQPVYHSVQKIKEPVSDLKAESGRILRNVPDVNAFYFYKMLHYYLDVKARNLAEFLEQLRTIDAESIAFHVSRGDFGNWFGTTLGDADLAGLVSTLSGNRVRASGEELRVKLANMVQTRLTSLKSF
jgi:hypothetical protein